MSGGIVGINAFHGDAAAAAIADGVLVAGVEEERFTRIKHWAGFPETALRHCLGELAAVSGPPDAVAVSRKPDAYALQKVLLALRNPRSLVRALSRVRNLAQVASLGKRLEGLLGPGGVPPVHAVEHHLAHVASSFYCSPFEEAACLTVDGFGDFVSTMLAVGRGNKIEVLDRNLEPRHEVCPGRCPGHRDENGFRAQQHELFQPDCE